MDGAAFATQLLYTVTIACIAGIAVYGMVRQTRKRRALEHRLSGVTDVDVEVARVAGEVEAIEADYLKKRALRDKLAEELATYDENLAFSRVGLYPPHFEFPDSESYRTQIDKLRQQQKAMISASTAIVTSAAPPAEEDRARNVAALDRQVKLTLRAYNAECDAAIALVRWSNIGAMEKRIIRARELIDELNAPHQIFISKEYGQLKLKELYLTHELREKARHEREEESAHAKIASEELKLDRDVEAAASDEQRFGQLLAKARLEASSIAGGRLKAFDGHLKQMEANLAEARARLARAQTMIERNRSGFVFIVSNIGSFGEGVVKIGLTRRLDVEDKVRELGEGTTPYPFDIHAIIHSDDAPALAQALWRQFADKRVNTSDTKRDFFRVDLDELAAAVKRLAPDAGFVTTPDAQDYRETRLRAAGPSRGGARDESETEVEI